MMQPESDRIVAPTLSACIDFCCYVCWQSNGSMPQHLAAERGNLETFTFLVEDCK